MGAHVTPTLIQGNQACVDLVAGTTELKVEPPGAGTVPSKRALKEKDEKLRKDYWWLYHNAADIEPEIREMVLKAENLSMLERLIEAGLMHKLMEAEKNNPPPEAAAPETSVSD